MLKIASVDGLECLFARSKNFKHLCLIPRNAQSESFIEDFKPYSSSKNLHSKKNIEFLVNDELIVRQTNLTETLKTEGINMFFLAHRSSQYIENWAKKNKITLIRTEWKLQKNFEDKIFFQKFLDKYSIPSPTTYILNSKKDFSKVKNFPAVIQFPYVNPPLPATFLRGVSDLKEFLNRKEIKFPLICREYVNGKPLGVSILLGEKKMVFSSLRLQCFADKKDPFSEFLGIQWVSYKRFKKTEMENLNRVVLALAKALQKEKFTGVANVDLISNDNGVYVLECNPRMSSATPCLALERQLVHGINFTEEFVNSLTKGELNFDYPKIPETTFEGTLIEFDFLIDEIKRDSNIKMISCLPKPGFWQFEANRLTYSGKKEKYFKNKSGFFFYSSLPKNFPIDDTKHLGLAFTNFPLFDFDSHKNTCKESTKGRRFIKSIIERLRACLVYVEHL